MIARARELSKQPNTFWTDQFNNTDNKNGYHKMGEEIVHRLNSFDAFVMSVGTGGCFSGNSEVIKEQLNNVKCVAVEPASSRHLSKGPLGGHRIEGIGPGFVPRIMRMDLVDRIISEATKTRTVLLASSERPRESLEASPVERTCKRRCRWP